MSAALLAAAERYCCERGEKFTDQRREVLALLLAAEGSIKAYELLAQIQKLRPSAAPPTVYRALDFLVANGLAHKLDSKNAFVACHDFEHPHHGVLLLCTGCQHVTELSDEGLRERLQQDAARYGFAPSFAQDIEVHGLCRACREAKGEQLVVPPTQGNACGQPGCTHHPMESK